MPRESRSRTPKTAEYAAGASDIEAPGHAAVQDDASLNNVLLTGLHTTFLATRAAPRGFKIHTMAVLIARIRAYGGLSESTSYF